VKEKSTPWSQIALLQEFGPKIRMLNNVDSAIILNEPVSRSMLNEAYPYRYPCASSPVSRLFEGSEVSSLYMAKIFRLLYSSRIVFTSQFL
jgi:hypothetical protein